jgi:hypothetical protein
MILKPMISNAESLASGYIIWQFHDKLNVFDLRANERVKYLDIPNDFEYDHFNVVNNRMILYSGYPVVIKLYDFVEKKLKLLQDGKCPIYFDKYDMYVYIKSYYDEKEKTYIGNLYRSKLSSDKEEQVSENLKIYSFDCPVKVNDRKVLVYLSEYPINSTVIFDVIDGDIVANKLTENVRPMLKVNDGFFICYDREKSGEYFVCDVSGKLTKKLNFDFTSVDYSRSIYCKRFLFCWRSMYPAAYFEEIDSILISERSESLFFGYTIALWLYNLSDNTYKFLTDKTTTNEYTAIYLTKLPEFKEGS